MNTEFKVKLTRHDINMVTDLILKEMDRIEEAVLEEEDTLAIACMRERHRILCRIRVDMMLAKED